MELWLGLLALWLWECLAFLPPGGSFVTLARKRAALRHKPGLFLAAPWPLRFGFALDGLPFEANERAAIGAGPLSFFAATAAGREQRSLPWSENADANGAVVRLGAKPLLRASTEAAAERIAGALREIARAAPEQRAARAARAWEAALAEANAAARIARVRRATLPHRALAALALSAIGLGVPGMALLTRTGWNAVWDETWLLFAGLHAMGFLALVGAELALRAPGRGSRLLRAALYPPTQWRASSELASAALGELHPLVATRTLGDAPSFLAHARRALAECDFPRLPADVSEADASARRAALAARRGVLAAFLERAGLAEQIAAPPARRDRSARSYCPRCFEEFVMAGFSCTDCGVATLPYPAAQASALAN